MDNFIAKTVIDNILSKTNFPKSERDIIGNNTKKLLQRLSPVVVEILLYDSKQTSVQLNK